MMTPTVQSVLRATYDGPMFEGLPPGTTWAGDSSHPMWWDSLHRRYLFGLRTPIGGEYFYTLASIEERELERLKFHTTLAGWQELVHAKLKLLRMRHYFGLVYRRGGYC